MKDLLRTFSDDQLIKLYRQGDEMAFNELYARYENVIRTTIRMVVKDDEEASDVFQEYVQHTFLKKLKGTYECNGFFSSWQRRVLKNYLCSYFRSSDRKKNIKLCLEQYPDISLYEEDRVSESRHEGGKLIRELVESLPEEYRKLILMRSFADMTYQEMSECTGINRSTLVARVKHAQHLLKQMLKEKGYDYYL
ncbi:RNA polymerase sigma factor [uncultured Bacteroides sp.]|uniref:RNA polymerase sigma factor n=1 Tax=uncultured Bacteroides sp. TaxID=162156 RepID=UPI00261DDDA3|nr:RNA polymerase sigma factor [uncultured Bacteroides sp.]